MLAISFGTVGLIDKRLDHFHNKLGILHALTAKLLAWDRRFLELPSRILIHPSHSIIVNSNNNHATDVWVSLNSWDYLPRVSNIGFLAVKDILPVMKINNRVKTVCIFLVILRQKNTHTTLLSCIRNLEFVFFHF